MYTIIFYVPESHLESVKNALFQAGAGRIGDYCHCAWQTKGQGQFMPLTGSNAFIGTVGTRENVDEYKVEMVCADSFINTAIIALKQAHPYETPAYQVFKTEPL